MATHADSTEAAVNAGATQPEADVDELAGDEPQANEPVPEASREPGDENAVEQTDENNEAAGANPPNAGGRPAQGNPQTAVHLQLTDHVGDIFNAPPDSVLIHACNTQGSWGFGIALAFRKYYPEAYTVYHNYCNLGRPPCGSTLLIPPCEVGPNARRHYIGCLFTSERSGQRKDPPNVILGHTTPAIKDLLRQLLDLERQGRTIGTLRICKINSQAFAVPWQRTRTLMQNLVVPAGCKQAMEIWDRPPSQAEPGDRVNSTASQSQSRSRGGRQVSPNRKRAGSQGLLPKRKRGKRF